MSGFDLRAFEEARRSYVRSHQLPAGRAARRGGRPVTLVALLLGLLIAGALVSGAGAQSVSDLASVLHLGARNPGAGATAGETQIIGESKDWVVRQSNLGTGGSAIFGCRASEAGACVRSSNLDTGRAFSFATHGLLGGTIDAGNGGDATRPFTTNATGVATGLNADRVDGHDGSDFLLKNGTAADTAHLGGHPADDFLAAKGTAANSDRLGGLPASAFARADSAPVPSGPVDAATLDGLDSTDFLQMSHVLVLHRPPTFSVGQTVTLGSAQGIGVKASCTGSPLNPALHVLMSTDTIGTRFATADNPAATQVSFSPDDHDKDVLDVDNNFFARTAVYPVSVAIVKPDGAALQGELTLAIKWGGQDCHASGMLFG